MGTDKPAPALPTTRTSSKFLDMTLLWCLRECSLSLQKSFQISKFTTSARTRQSSEWQCSVQVGASVRRGCALASARLHQTGKTSSGQRNSLDSQRRKTQACLLQTELQYEPLDKASNSMDTLSLRLLEEEHDPKQDWKIHLNQVPGLQASASELKYPKTRMKIVDSWGPATPKCSKRGITSEWKTLGAVLLSHSGLKCSDSG